MWKATRNDARVAWNGLSKRIGRRLRIRIRGCEDVDNVAVQHRATDVAAFLFQSCGCDVN